MEKPVFEMEMSETANLAWLRGADLEARYGLGKGCPATMTPEEAKVWDEKEARGENVGQMTDFMNEFKTSDFQKERMKLWRQVYTKMLKENHSAHYEREAMADMALKAFDNNFALKNSEKNLTHERN